MPGIAFEFLDVGQGDCTLVELPPWDSGELFLVDLGKKSARNEPINDALTFLFREISTVCGARDPAPQTPRVEYLCITHSDSDHWNQLGHLIQGTNPDGATDQWHAIGGYPQGTQMGIGTLVIGGRWATYQGKDEALAAVIEGALLDADNQPIVELPIPHSNAVGDPQWHLPGVNIYILSANRGTVANADPDAMADEGRIDPNPNSVVLMFEYTGDQQHRKVILTGDAESTIVEPAIIATYQNDANFLNSVALKLGHHGSNGATSQAWIEAVLPQVVFASGDRYWGHPYCGAISMAVDHSQLMNIGNHRYVCGNADSNLDGNIENNPSDYNNRTTTAGVCTNLWYVVKDIDGFTGLEPVEDGDPVEREQDWGFYQGTQWRFELNANVDTAPPTCVPAWPLIPPANNATVEDQEPDRP